MTQANNITVVIADDHPIVRKGIRDLIVEDGRYSVVEEVGDGSKVLGSVRKFMPKILLLDVNLPGRNGLDIALEIQTAGLPVEIIVMTMHKEAEVFDRAMDAGVKGYLLKESAEDDLLKCIEVVLDGDCYISPQISKHLMNRKTKSDQLHRAIPGLALLSPSELRILKLIAGQSTSKEIADLLHVSVKTVHNHRTNICNKLELHGVNALLKFAIENRSRL
jgi:DNA-binding NarL/FixJ family response regulator